MMVIVSCVVFAITCLVVCACINARTEDIFEKRYDAAAQYWLDEKHLLLNRAGDLGQEIASLRVKMIDANNKLVSIRNAVDDVFLE